MSSSVSDGDAAIRRLTENVSVFMADDSAFFSRDKNQQED